MIVFNMYAILVALFIALASLPVILLHYFNVIGEEISIVLATWIALGVTLICKKSNIDGRLFWIPMWILAIPLVPFATYSFYGWIGIIATVGIFVGIVALIFILSYVLEKKRIKNITNEDADFVFDETDLPTSWKTLQDKFFFPTFSNMSPDVCAYNLRVAEKVERLNLELATLSEFKEEMKYQSISVGGDGKANKDVIKRFTKEIEQRIADLEKNTAEAQAA